MSSVTGKFATEPPQIAWNPLTANSLFLAEMKRCRHIGAMTFDLEDIRWP